MNILNDSLSSNVNQDVNSKIDFLEGKLNHIEEMVNTLQMTLLNSNQSKETPSSVKSKVSVSQANNNTSETNLKRILAEVGFGDESSSEPSSPKPKRQKTSHVPKNDDSFASESEPELEDFKPESSSEYEYEDKPKINKPNRKVKKNKNKKLNDSRSRWTVEEDSKLARLVKKYNYDFSKIYRHFPSRRSSNIKERYENFVNPSIKRDRLNQDEKKKILKLFREIKEDWQQITDEFNKDKKDGEKRSRKAIHGFLYYRKGHDVKDGLELSDHSAEN